MMKRVLCMMVIGAVLVTGSAVGFAQNGEKSLEKQAMKLEKMQAAAERLGIDISGMTATEAKAALQDARAEKLMERAAKLGIDVEGMTPEQIKAAVEAARAEKLQALAERFGIDAAGMTPEELKAAVKAAKEEKRAGKGEKQPKAKDTAPEDALDLEVEE